MNGPDDQLSRASVVPLYFQLQELLKEKIEAGAWSPDELIPSEPELCATYEVSRTVVRQALAILEQDGQIRRVRGRGTFVAAPKIEQRVGGICRLLLTESPARELVVLDAREEPPSRRVADQLELGRDTRILRVMTLLRIAGAPVALFDSFFPTAEVGTLRRYLDHPGPIARPAAADLRGIDLTRSTVAIETSFCSKWEAEQLDIPFHGAVFVTLCTEHRRRGQTETPYELVRAVYRVDRVQFQFDVSSNGEIPQATWQLAQTTDR